MASPLEPVLRKRVADAVAAVIRDQVDPWADIADGPPFQIKGFHGAHIGYSEPGYMGIPQRDFWTGYIEPFLEQICVTEIGAAVAAANYRDLDASEVLAELEPLLRVGIERVYREMARIDVELARLESPGALQRSASIYVERMNWFLAERIRAERELLGPAPEGRMARLEMWHARNRFRAWTGTSLLAAIALLLALLALTF